uniref:Ribosomal protein L5 n=1 Tax=Pseudo-nitzschia pungens TaxID=37318 RepID=A0A7T8E6I4_9STRA|nr:ribosomal protein L5 [Pseudo-nitzschia pungens]QQO80604.1 ribosomal protein L5 [Pseudo-nitzschia pungens]
MNPLENYYKKVIRYDLINKFFYHNLSEIPELKKIVLNFGCKSFVIKNIAASLVALELITTQQGTVTKAKRPNILLKVRKGHPVGCIVVLTKTKMYDFFLKLLTQVFPNFKDFKGIKFSKKLKSKSFSLTLLDLISFEELGKQFYLFTNLPPLNIILVTSAKTKKELMYLLNSFKMPFN